MLCGDDCVNPTNDPMHCGACNHDCGGGECLASACTAIALAQFEKMHGLALHDGNVCFTTSTFDGIANDTVACASKVDGSLVTLSSEEMSAQHVVALGDRLYWTSWEAGAVRSAALDEPNTIREEWTGDPAFGIQGSGTDVFFARYTEGLSSFSAASAWPPTVTDVVTGTQVVLLVIDPTGDVVFTVPDSLNGVRRYSVMSADVSNLTMTDVDAWGITQDAEFFYYSDQAAGMLHRINKTTSEREMMADGLTDPRGLAVDENYVYVAELDRVRRVAIDGFAKSNVAAGSRVSMIAADDNFLYWTDYGDGALKKMAKPL